MKLDLHTHTNHSFDSKLSVEELLRSAEKNHLDAIAICDHDTMSAVGLAEKKSGKLMIIPGMEISCDKGIHLIGLFLKEEIVSRDLLGAIDEIHSQGGLALLPHPFRPISGLLHGRYKGNLLSGEETGKALAKIDLIEAINFRCPDEAMLETEKYLQSYPGLPQIAASDAHHASEVGKARLELDDFNTTNLEDIKTALIGVPCLLRFEVYTPEIGVETRKIIEPRLGRKLAWKAKRFLHRSAQISRKRIFGKYPIRSIEAHEKETNEKSK